MEERQAAKLPDLDEIIWPKIFQFLEYDDLLNLKVYGELKEVTSLYVRSKTVVIKAT